MSKYLSQYSTLRRSARAHHPLRTLGVGLLGAGLTALAIGKTGKRELRIGGTTFRTDALLAATLLGASALGVGGKYAADLMALGLGAGALYVGQKVGASQMALPAKAAASGGPYEIGAGDGEQLSHRRILRAAGLAPG